MTGANHASANTGGVGGNLKRKQKQRSGHLLGSTAMASAVSLAFAGPLAHAQTSEIADPSVSVLAFTGTNATVVDAVTLTDFASPLIADSGSILFGSNQRYFVSSGSGLEIITDLNANPLFIPNTATAGLPRTITLDQQTGDAFLGNGPGGQFFEGNVDATLFEQSIDTGTQITVHELRAQDGQLLVVDDNDILFRGANAGDELGILLVATPSQGVQSGVPNDPKFGGTNTVVASFSLNTSDTNLEQAYSVRPLEGSSGLSRGPVFDVSNDQVFGGVTIPAGQFNTSSSLDQISSNGTTVAFTLPVAETASGNFGVALVTQTITRDDDGNVTGVTDGTPIIFDIFSQIIDGVPLSTTITTLGERVFLAAGTQFEAEINPTVSANGDVIFFGRASVPGGDDIVSGYWRLRASDGIVEPFLTDGMQIDGISSFGTEDFGILDFDSDLRFGTRLAIEPRLTINRDGNVAAVVRLLLPNNADPVTAIVGQNVSGDLFLVAHEGQEVDLGGDAGVRTVAIADSPAFQENVVFVTGGVNGNEVINSNDLDGVSDGFNDSSQLAFVLSFTDGSQALLRADLGAAGAPNITVFRWTGGCGSAEWGTRCTIDSEGASNWSNFDPPGQVATEAPGLSADPADVFIMNADVNITQDDVAITTLTATDSTLTVERSLTLAQASSVDELVVNGGTVTSGSGPVTANNVTLMGGTLNGTGGFDLLDRPSNDEALLLIEAGTGGAASVIDTFVTATDGTVRFRDDARLIINDLSSLTVQGDAGILRLATGSVISGEGDLIIRDSAELAAAFDTPGTATISAPLRLGDSLVFAASESIINITGSVTIIDAFSEIDFMVSGTGKINITGPLTEAEDSNATIRLIGELNSPGTTPQIAFDGSQITLGESGSIRVGYPDFRSGTQATSVANAFASPIVGAFTDTNITLGSFFAIQAPTLFSGATVDAVFSGNSGATILLEGENNFTLRTQRNNANVTSAFNASVLAQRSGTTTFGGDTPLLMRDLIDTTTRVFVSGGTLNFQTPVLNILGTERPGAILAPSGNGRIVVGALADDARLDLRLNNLQIGQGNAGLSGGGVDVVRADISAFEASSDPLTISNQLNTAGAVVAERSLALRDVTVNSALVIENDGPLLISRLSGLENVELNNRAGVLLTGEWSNVGQITNEEDSVFTFDGPLGELRGGDFLNQGTLAVADDGVATIGSNLRVRSDTNPTAAITGQFDIGENARLTASRTELLDTVRDPGNDIEARGAALDGMWTLENGSVVMLGENTVIEDIAAGASLTLRGSAQINGLSASNNTLKALRGQFSVFGANPDDARPDIAIGSDFVIGGPTASGASLTAGGLSVVGDLLVASGSVTLNDEGGRSDINLNVDGQLSVFGTVTTNAISAASAIVQAPGSVTLGGDITALTNITVDGTLTNISDASSQLGNRIIADSLTINSGGTARTDGLVISDTIINNGTLVFGGGLGAGPTTFTAGAGSTTTFEAGFLEFAGDASLGGSIRNSDTSGGNGSFSAEGDLTLGPDFSTSSDILTFDSQQRLRIENGATLDTTVSLGGINIDIASSVRISDASSANADLGGQRFTIESGGRVTGVGMISGNATFLGFDLGARTQPALVDFTTSVIEAGAVTAGDLAFSGTVINRGSWFPGFSPGLGIVAGDYVQEATGLLELEVGGVTPDLYDALLVGGTATFDPASTINITLIDPNPDDGVDEVFRPRTGDTFDVLLADSVEVTGGGDIADIIIITNADQSGSFIPSFMTVDGQFMLQLEAMFGSRLAETAGLNTLQGGIAAALDGISETADNDALTDFAVALDQLEDGAAGSALSQVGFDFASGLYDMGFAAAEASAAHINRHIDARIWSPAGAPSQEAAIAPASRAAQMVLGDASFAGGQGFEDAAQVAQMVASIGANQGFAFQGAQGSKYGLIASGSYSFGSFDASANQSGFEYSGGGGIVGGEVAAADNVVLGVSAGITSLSGDTDNALGEVEATHYSIGAHGVVEAGPIVIDGQAQFGWLDMETERRVSLAETSYSAESEGDGSTFAGRLRASLPLKGGSESARFVFGPSVEFSAAKVKLDSVAETGAVDLGLQLSGQSQWRTKAAIALNAAATLEMGKTRLSPRASIAYETFLSRDSEAVVTNFIGAPAQAFGTPVDQIDKDGVKVLTALDLRLSRRLSASFGYSGALSGDQKRHSVLAQVRAAF